MDNANANSNEEWMLPSDALTRHTPPLGVLFSDTEDEKAESRYGFIIGSLGCLISNNTLSEVINNPVIYKLPTFSKILIGVSNQRGNIVPVFDFRQLLSDSDISQSQTLLVLGQGNKVAGIMIDGLPQTIQVTDHLEDNLLIPDSFRPYITPAFSNSGRTWAELDYENLLRDAASGIFQEDDSNSTK
jgi:chemotaxis signal transduction protein